MKLKLTVTAVLLVITVLFTGCTSGRMTVTPKDGVTASKGKGSVTITVIGDSIAMGYGLDSTDKRYSNLLRTSFEKDGIKCTEYNYGVSGAETSHLLADLRKDKYTGITDSDYVIVSIGANNVMACAMNFFKNHISAFISKSDGDGTTLDEYTEFISEVMSGINTFEEDLPYIISEIHEKTEAVIILQTVYNPFKNSELYFYAGGTRHGLSALADSYIVMLNEVIHTYSAACVYAVADIYSAFAVSNEKCVNADTESSIIGIGLDPHPNSAGHRLIASTIYAMMKHK